MSIRKVSDLLARVRAVLQDQDQTGYRYPTSDLVGYLNDAVFETRRLRPDIFIGKFRTRPTDISTVPNVDYSTIEFPLPDQCFVAVVDYVAGRTELRDDEFAVDGRAMTLISSLSTKLMGGG